MSNIANIITKIRNAYLIKKKIVCISYNKFSYEFVKILYKEGFIENIRYHKENKNIFIILTLKERKQIHIKYIRNSHKKFYVNHKKLPKILGGMGLSIISTSSGLMTNKEARLKNIGGEVLLYIW
uniref:ribosomal protein S8 n=1 Tax=Hydnora longicollis TaxID=1778543 RepID=UPI002115B2DB|nr:ribosomal protein S8 [Hydnora longicollis]USN93655.1 ribosomal protein S8 [Hydnora longicollis]